MSVDAPIWENCKENVMPIKRGRSVKVLEDSLSLKSSETRAQLENQEKLFEKNLKENESSPKQDLLEIYLKYFKWIRDAYPSRSDKALVILERCTTDLKEEATLKNDVRFVKLWIEYVISYKNTVKFNYLCDYRLIW